MGIRLEVRTEEGKWVTSPEDFHSKDKKNIRSVIRNFCKRHGIPYSNEFVSIWAMPSDQSQLKKREDGRTAWISRNADEYGKEIILLGEHVVDSLAYVACGDFQNIILCAVEREKAGIDVQTYLKEKLFIFTEKMSRNDRIATLESASAIARCLSMLGDAEARLLRPLKNDDKKDDPQVIL